MPACPSDDDLRQLAHESISPATFAGIESHVAGCPDCQRRLAVLAREWPSTEPDPPDNLPAKGTRPTMPGFEIDCEIGRGAMGVVYLARDQKLGRQVALKIMPGSHVDDARNRRRWRAEAAAFSVVRHPNVVTLYEIGETESWLFLVLEYIPGGSLKKRLDGPVPPESAAGLVARIAVAVERIHRAGLLHLDLKPSNILIDAEHDVPLDLVTPKVADFGISRLMQCADADADHTGSTLMGPWGGTASYMAPEQITGARAELGPAADVHALGAILYELVTGRPPFQGDSVVHTLDMVRQQEPVSPRRINPRIARDLETITLKCLQKEPGRRYQSAQAFAEDLTRCLDHRPILARPVSRPERAWRWCRRRPALATSLGVLAATVLFSFVALQALYTRAARDRDKAEATLRRETVEKEIAFATIGGFEIFLDCTGSRPGIEVGQLVGMSKSLREELAKARNVPGVERDYLLRLSALSERVADWLAELDRLDDARAILNDRIEFLNFCSAEDPLSKEICWNRAKAYLRATKVEAWANRPLTALAQLDRAASALKGADSDPPERQFFATCVSDAYKQLENQFLAENRLAAAERARRGQRSLLALLEGGDSGRLDLILARACLAADIGEWDRASVLVDDLFEAQRSLEDQPATVWPFVQPLLEQWLVREIRNWDDLGSVVNAAGSTSPRPADRIVGLIANSRWPLHDDDHKFGTLETMVRHTFHSIASRYRRFGRLDRAERIAILHFELAQALIRKFPHDANWRGLLADAYMQQHKNAWKTENKTEIKRGLERSIEVLEDAMVLDPNNPAIRRDLLDHIKRLANLRVS